MKRNAGLDLMRAAAILLVLLSHALSIFYLPLLRDCARWSELCLRLSFFLGYAGVELFFVLSGFLIGGILLRSLEPESVGRFWARRWLRTLPLYYLVILLWSAYTGEWHPSYFFFWQNMLPGELDFFPVSWSLCLEEWFYLLLPPALLAALFIGRERKRSLGWGLLALLIFFSLLRAVWVAYCAPTYDWGVRKSLFLRFDVLLLGVMAAYIRHYCFSWYRKAAGQSFWPAAVLTAVTFVCFLGQPVSGYDHSFFMRTALFSVFGLAAVFWLVFFEQKKLAIWKLTRNLSLYSYSIYLFHFPVFLRLGDGEPLFWAVSARMAAAFVIVYLAGSISYRYFEYPILRWRDKIFSS